MCFENYTKNMPFTTPIGNPILYIFTSQEGMDWFDPIKPYTELEYKWVMDKVALAGKTVIDAGCHQGNYAVLFAACGANVVAVDAWKQNCDATALNLAQYDGNHNVHNFALWSNPGVVHFTPQSNGRVIKLGGVEIPARKLSSFGDADVVKIDIEGAEFEILPQAFDEMPYVNTWIIEIHPNHNPAIIIKPLAKLGFDILIVDRDLMTVHPYHPRIWDSHATIIGVRHG